MKKLAILAFVTMSFAAVRPVYAEPELMSAATTNQVVWPDYRSAPWVIKEKEMFVVEVAIPVENNAYVLGPGIYKVRIGSSEFFMDSEEDPKTAISEYEILGSPAIRTMYVRVETGGVFVGWQFMLNGKWWSAPLDSRLSINLDDPAAIVRDGKLSKVILTLNNEAGVVMKLVIENSSPPKSRK